MAMALLKEGKPRRQYHESTATSQLGTKNLKRGVQLPLVLKPIKRQGLWKGTFVLFQRPATRGRGAPVQRLTSHTDNQGVGGAFIDGGRGYMQKQTVSSGSLLETGPAVV